MNLLTLRFELDNDPVNIGYQAMTNEQIVIAINAKNQQIERDIIDTWELLGATVPEEYTNLTTQEKQRYQIIISAGRVNITNNNLRTALANMFVAGTQTRTNMINLQFKLGSRAEVIEIGNVSLQDIIDAKNLEI